MQVKPHPALAHVVRHYLVLRGQQTTAWKHRLFADGNTGLVFNLGDASLHMADSRPLQQSSWLYGQINTYRDISLSGNINWIVVVFHPYGAYHLFGVPATEWYDCFFPAQEVLGEQLNILSSRLASLADINEQVGQLDRALLRLLDKQQAPDSVVIAAAKHITAQEGSLPISSLLKTLAVNERTLERKFKYCTGMTPKQFSAITRLNASAKRVQKMTRDNRLTDVAYDSGYFDQAHFIRDFKKYTGITPHQYQQEVHPLALNFLQL
jgi:AraC-like DNA-binding protein